MARLSTKELYKKLKTLSKEDLEKLGITYPPKKGWKRVIAAHFGMEPKKKKTHKAKSKSTQKAYEWEKLYKAREEEEFWRHNL